MRGVDQTAAFRGCLVHVLRFTKFRLAREKITPGGSREESVQSSAARRELGMLAL
jgi:hypothetical protein